MLDPVGSFAPVLDEVIPAVVTVLVAGETLRPNELGTRRADGTLPPFPEPRREKFRSGGSGVVVDPGRGHILTNNHVVVDAISIEVTLSNGRRMPARIVGKDPGTDLAVIEVADRNLPGIRIGDSDRARVGDVILAVGNPFGLEGTATLGIISALMRSGIGHEAIEDFLQIDAAINPGNSGGALVNVRGELIGINTAGSGDASRAAGIGFAIPINMARAIKAELIAHGRVRRGSIGLFVEDLSREQADALSMRVTRGAAVVDAIAGSPAANAGLRTGDIVIAVSGKPVRTAAEFDTRVATVPVGVVLDLAVVRDAGESLYKVAATEMQFAAHTRALPAELGRLAGLVVSDIRLGNPRFGQQRGALVAAVPSGTAAHDSGVLAGDVIVSVDEAPVRTTDDLLRLASRAAMQYRIVIQRDGVPAWVRMSR